MTAMLALTLVRVPALSRRLTAMLRGAHDDGEAELDVVHASPALVVRRADGSELSTTEEVEVRAILAADEAEQIE